jgi:hypothetical protein
MGLKQFFARLVVEIGKTFPVTFKSFALSASLWHNIEPNLSE